MLIEHAIFTSAESDTGGGYRLVAATSGITTSESHELGVWGPSHDSLIEQGPLATSVNFHALASGRFCVSKSVHAGSEYSRRGGLRVYTQFLVLCSEDLARFANNPFSLLRAATAQGRMQVLDRIPREIEPIRLSGKTPAVDHALLTEVLAGVGLNRLLALVDAALSGQQLVVVGNRERQQLIAGLFNCLPVECRPEFSFTTGLKPTPRRPFRLACVSEDSAEARRFGRATDVRVLRSTDETAAPLTTEWARYLQQVLGAGKTHSLGSHLAVSRDDLKVGGLDRLAESLTLMHRSAIDSLTCTSGESDADAVYPRLANVIAEEESPSVSAIRSAPTRAAVVTEDHSVAVLASQLSDAANGSDRMPSNMRKSSPIDALEVLDDTVFAAIAGNDAALQRLKQLWPSTVALWGDAELADSREHYIRRALSAWRQARENANDPDLGRAEQAIEVVCTLVGE